MTPKQELIYRLIKKYEPTTYTEIVLSLGGNSHGNGVILKQLEREGFIRKRCCKECRRDGLFETTKKKVRPNRVMPYMSRI